MATLGERIRHYREGLGLTLEALSEKSTVDVGTISALENRKSRRSQFAPQIAQALGLTVEQLLDETRDFLKDPPCPATGAPRGPCPGWIVDHVQPLCAGGADAPSNMQWQTAAAAKAKDRAERAQCRALRAPPRATRLYKC